MRKKVIVAFLGIFLSLVGVSFIAGSPFIYSDGYGYYHVAKNLVEEGSFVSEQKPEYYYYSAHTTNIYDNRYVTVYSSANAIFWWPFLTAAKPFNNGTIYTDYYKAYNGHSLADGVALQLAACFYATILILLLYKLLRDLNFSKKVALAGTGISLITTYIFGYIFINSSYSHLYEALSLTALLFCINRFRLLDEKKYLIGAGLAAGMLVLTRPANIVLLIPICAYLLLLKKFKALPYFILGAMPIALIYFLYNYDSFGMLIANGYKILWAEDFDFSKFNLGLLLFSTVRGWFVYSPVVVLSIIGLISYCKKEWRKALLYILPGVFLVGLYSFWPSWWAGDSLGQRFFLALLPILAVGISTFIARAEFSKFKDIRIPIYLILIILTTYSAGLLFLLRITDTRNLNEFNTQTALDHPEVSPAERFTAFDVIGNGWNLITTGQLDKFGNKDKSLLQIVSGHTEAVVKIENINDDTFKLHVLGNPNSPIKTTDIYIAIDKLGQRKEHLLQNIEINSRVVITFRCDKGGCFSDYRDMGMIREQMFNTEDLIPVNKEIKVGLRSSAAIIFIDYKLEDFKRYFVK